MQGEIERMDTIVKVKSRNYISFSWRFYPKRLTITGTFSLEWLRTKCLTQRHTSGGVPGGIWTHNLPIFGPPHYPLDHHYHEIVHQCQAVGYVYIQKLKSHVCDLPYQIYNPFCYHTCNGTFRAVCDSILNISSLISAVRLLDTVKDRWTDSQTEASRHSNKK